MKLLSIDCSASPASAAVTEDGKVISSAFVNIKVTHSQTLMTLVEAVLDSAFLTLSDIDGFAVSAGPGSFTGVRIGISAIKGMAEPLKKPCYAVSTLRSMAENIYEENVIINAVMDARCEQYYNALFIRRDGKLVRLCDDRAILHDELVSEIDILCKEHDCEFITVGDGADLFCEKSGTNPIDEQRKYQNAASVGLSVFFDKTDKTECEKLNPVYLRLPQAERELKRRKEEKL